MNKEKKMGDVVASSSGCFREVSPMNGVFYSWIELHHWVGGNIKAIDLGKRVLVYDSEGNRAGKLPNRLGMAWVNIHARETQGECGQMVIYGDVLLCDGERLRIDPANFD